MEHLAASLASSNASSEQVAELLGQLTSAGVRLDVFICSFGGVGSTELSNFLTGLGLAVNLLEDKDNLRHCPRPPSFRLKALAPRNVVYLYGCPVAAVASHYRRGHAHHQAMKTSGRQRLLPAASFPATFQDYLHRGEDLFGLQEHFSRWLTLPTSYPILCIRYERMFDPAVAEPLMQRLLGHRMAPRDVLEATAKWCASYKTRKSQVTDEQRAHPLYSHLRQQMEALPPLLLRPASGVREEGAIGGGGLPAAPTGHAAATAAAPAAADGATAADADAADAAAAAVVVHSRGPYGT